MDLDYNGFIEKIESTKNDSFYIPKMRYKMNEDNVPVMNIVPGWELNKRMDYDQAKMIQAVQNGMCILINYKGDKDKWMGSRERVICPLNLGVNKSTKNELIRGWHLEGFSVSQKKETKKVWRLFKTSNIKGMMFTGHFMRLPPSGYKSNDRVMTEKTIVKADFNQIRKNQEALIRAGKIEKEENIKITPQNSITTSIEVKNTGTLLDLKTPWDNELLKPLRNNSKTIRITILKTIFTNDYIAVIGALGEKNKTVKVFEDKKLLSNYKVIEAFTGDKMIRSVNGKSEFDLYTFVKKL